MTELFSNAYDEVSYPGFPFSQTHPDRLATIATLFGMKPAPIENCRVLELGCGDGGNLLPMAIGLPGSEFAGIDLAALPIARGRTMAAALGLKNVSLRQEDILQFSVCRGQYDYIIAHGIYSWVRQLLLLLDDTRNRAVLLSDLREFLESCLKTMEPNSELFNSTRHAMENLAVDLELNLQKLARLALLIE
jgi:cyclopropane fatty-acyl-phospholipid synthase-like methyltransferase